MWMKRRRAGDVRSPGRGTAGRRGCGIDQKYIATKQGQYRRRFGLVDDLL